jgi:hypothetical protein
LNDLAGDLCVDGSSPFSPLNDGVASYKKGQDRDGRERQQPGSGLMPAQLRVSSGISVGSRGKEAAPVISIGISVEYNVAP